MISKVFHYVEQNKMLTAGDVVAAGISGGADSVCLLFLLNKLQEKIPFKLLVVHVNHGIRTEADSDEAYVKTLCDKWQVPFFSIKENVKVMAEQQGISEEEAGRNLRYNSFTQILQKEAFKEWEEGKAKIAVAHNQNDRAETMLFNLVRGTGLKGLCSIQPVRDRVIRPLLCLSRAEIEQILKEENIAYCTDCTNAQDTYTRNKIRNRVFPYITEEISPAAIEKMNHAADLLTEADGFIREETEKAWSRVEIIATGQDTVEDVLRTIVPGADQVIINVPALMKEAPFLQGQLILNAIGRIYPGKKDITAAHVQAIKDLCNSSGSKSINLPYGILIKKEYDRLIFRIQECEGNDKKPEAGCVEINQIPGTYPVINYLGEAFELEFEVFPYKKDEPIPQNKYTKWFDYDKIDKSLCVRTRRSGDYLTINDQMSHKSLKDYLIGEKIPKELRDDLWLLTEEDHVLWVIGYRISTKYKIDENTKRILQVQLKGGASWLNM